MRSLASIAFCLLAVACIKEQGPEPPVEVQCETGDECPTGTCHQGICVGPAAQEFAAELVPPEGRTDLATTEIQTLEIDEFGEIHGLSFGDSVEVSGRVVLSPTDTELSIGARLVFRRPSRIPGVGDYIVRTVATRGLHADEGPAFSVRLPRPGTDPASGLVVPEEWELTIYPDDGTIGTYLEGETAPSAVAPPDRITLLVDGDSTEAVFPLIRTGGVKWIHGYVQDASGRGIEGIQVRAFGRFAPGRPLEIASSTGTTDADGYFVVKARVEWEDEFELELRPTSDVIAPVLRRAGVLVEDPQDGLEYTAPIDTIRFPAFALPQPYSVPVTGFSSGGTQTGAEGTVVQLVTSLPSDNGDVVTFTADGIVGVDGTAEVDLIPGTVEANRQYAVTAIPPQGSPLGAIWDGTLDVGLTSGTLAQLVLPSRVYVTGHVADAEGLPAAFVLVRVVLAPALTLGLDDADRTRLTALSLPETQTDENGDYSFYLDAAILDQAARYELEIVPPVTSLRPRWVAPLSVPESADATYAAGVITLPGATYAWGEVLDPFGDLVSGADLRVYLLPDPTLCATLAMPDCQAPARMMAQAKSDEAGHLTVVLPDQRP